MKVSQTGKTLLWAVQIVLAIVFLTVGMAKLTGVESSVALFNKIGAGQWLRYVTGAIEVAGALFLLFGSRAAIGAGLILAVMLGAVMSHLWLIGGSALPAVVLGVMAATVLYFEQDGRRVEWKEEQEEESHRKSA
jgi:uncharacterized membrane protein YphA (DoxX/SURF4 family)